MDAEYKRLSLWKGVELVLCADGTYTLQQTDTTPKFSDTNSSFLIQCYSNGCINKVPIEDLNTLMVSIRWQLC